MSQDTFNRYTSDGGRPVNEMGHTIPGIEFSESERPAVGLLPAPYLAAGRFDEHKRAYVVLSAGVPVALDGAGALVPAGIPGGHVFTYTANDFATGHVAARSAADGTAVAAAGDVIMASGLTDNKTGNFLRPIGVVSYTVFSHEGGVSGTWPNYGLYHDRPQNYGIHNTMAQDLAAVTCDYALQVPYIYGRNLLAATAKVFDNTAAEIAVVTAAAKSYPFAHDELIPTVTVTQNSSGLILSTGISGSLVGLEIVAVSPDCGTGTDGAAAGNNDALLLTSGATGMTFTAAGDTAGEPVTFATLAAKGNHILYSSDKSKYVVLRNRLGATPTVGAAGNYFRMTLGDQMKPSDFVVCRYGRFVKYDETRHDEDEIFGQVLRVDKSPADKDYLKRVKTAYARSATVSHRMAGSATRGVPYLLHLVTDGAQIQYETQKTLAGTALNSSGMTTPPLALVVINMLR